MKLATWYNEMNVSTFWLHAATGIKAGKISGTGWELLPTHPPFVEEYVCEKWASIAQKEFAQVLLDLHAEVLAVLASIATSIERPRIRGLQKKV